MLGFLFPSLFSSNFNACMNLCFSREHLGMALLVMEYVFKSFQGVCCAFMVMESLSIESPALDS